MFLGDHDITLIGHDAILVVATTRGKTDYVPPAIRGVVGKKCLVVADVTQEALDADNIKFHVSNSELISTAAPAVTSTSNTKTPTDPGKSALLST